MENQNLTEISCLEEQETEEKKAIEGKKMLRKLRKAEKKKQKCEVLKKFKKLSHKKQANSKKQKRKLIFQEMTHEQILEFKERELMLKEEKIIKEIMAYQYGIPLIFDLSFEDKMSDLEMNSLAFQLCHTVGIFRKQNLYPFKIIMTSCKGQILQSLQKMGVSKWNINLKQEPVNEIPEFQQCCMLSPDAEETLPEQISWDRYFIIGGIVDRTEKKFQTLNKAKSLNIPSYKIPLCIQVNFYFR